MFEARNVRDREPPKTSPDSKNQGQQTRASDSSTKVLWKAQIMYRTSVGSLSKSLNSVRTGALVPPAAEQFACTIDPVAVGRVNWSISGGLLVVVAVASVAMLLLA
jgi:hypothetical protein